MPCAICAAYETGHAYPPSRRDTPHRRSGSVKILHVTPSYLPATRYGGPIVAVHGLCKALVRKGNDVSVLTTNVNGQGVSGVEVDVPVDVDGVKVTYFSSPYFRRLFYAPNLETTLVEKIRRYDLVHGHSIYLWPTMAAAKACHRHKTPYVISPRGMLVEDLVKKKNRLLKTAWLRFVEKKNFEKADLVHFTSRIEEEEARRFDLRMTRTCVLPNGIDIDEMESCGSPDCAKERKDYEPQILYLGRVHWKKGLKPLIRAMALLPRGALVIAGNDEDGYRKQLEKLAARSGLGDRVRFVGPKYGMDKYRALADAHVAVLTSTSENFGNTVLESMAMGRPVVVSRAVGLAETIRESGAGLVVDGDPHEIANAINALIEDPRTANSMGERGRETARERYSWDVVVPKYVQQYRQLLQASRNDTQR